MEQYEFEQEPFDASELEGAGQAKESGSYLIYVACPDRESFVKALRLLTLGNRVLSDSEDFHMAQIKGTDYLHLWADLLTVGVE